jgi:beta-lactamase class A
MTRRAPRRLLAFVLALAAAAVPTGARADVPARYDVAYLWHVDAAAAAARRDEVAAVLGPGAAERLRVVLADGAYAVVGLRGADRASAAAAAAVQTAALARANRGTAWPVASRDWVEVAEDALRLAAAQRAPAAAPLAPENEAVRAARLRQFEQLIEEHISQLRRQGLISRDERTAWSVYDFTTGATLVEINADIELQSASLVKPFLALAYMRRVEEGKLAYDDGARVQMERMIQRSDNGSADWIMHRLGGPAAVQRLLREQYGAMLPGVEIKEYIPSSGRTYRNKASARDYSRFLLALWRDQLPGSKEIKRLMALPKRDRLRTGVALGDDTEVYSKTGSTSRLCGDMGVLRAKGPDGREYAYTLIGIIEKRRPARHYFRWLRARGNVIRDISGLVYRSLGSIYGFAPTQ